MTWKQTGDTEENILAGGRDGRGEQMGRVINKAKKKKTCQNEIL